MMRLLIALGFLAPMVVAAEPAPQPRGKPTRPQSLALAMVAEEERWEFRPVAGRADPFYDREAVMKIDRSLRAQAAAGKDGAVSGPASDERKEAAEWLSLEVRRIESMVSQRQHEEAMKSAETALRRVERFLDDAEISVSVTRLKALREQALDALVHDEAKAAFDALGLRINGVLWTESGSRLAIIGSEPRALGVNDRVLDCTIINIDTDRVDFRFVFKSPRVEQSRRFEFPRYVGEGAAAPSPR